MSKANLTLDYINLANLIEFEINKREIEVKSYPIKVKNLEMHKDSNFLVISSDIISKWNASFLLRAMPTFNAEKNTLQLHDIELKLTSKNLIFRGVLNLIKGNILKRIGEMSKAPLTPMIGYITNMLDKEIEKAELPYRMAAKSSTRKLELLEMKFEKDNILVTAQIEQDLNISFKEISQTKTQVDHIS